MVTSPDSLRRRPLRLARRITTGVAVTAAAVSASVAGVFFVQQTAAADSGTSTTDSASSSSSTQNSAGTQSSSDDTWGTSDSPTSSGGSAHTSTSGS